MEITVSVDEELLRQAQENCEPCTDSETVNKGLKMLIRHNAYQYLRTFLGTETEVVDVPRRREPAMLEDIVA